MKENNSIDYTDVIYNEFLWFTSEIYISLSSVVKNREGYYEGCKEYELYTEDEKRIAALSQILSGFTHSIEAIEYSFRFMQDYELLQDTLTERGITEDEYINYHYDVFCHKVSTIRDVFFKIINNLYDLNIRERDCDWSHIEECSDKINNPYLFEKLNAYWDYMRYIIQVRQTSSHEGKIRNPAFSKISASLFIKNISPKLSKRLSEEFLKSIDEDFSKAKSAFFTNLMIHKENVYRISRCVLCTLKPALENLITEEIKLNHPDAIEIVKKQFPNFACDICSQISNEAESPTQKF